MQGNHAVYYTRDPATGIYTDEEWWKGDKVDREDGPAVIERDAATGVLTCDGWYKDGKRFEPSPAIRAAWLEKSGERTAPLSDAAKHAQWKCNHP